MCRMLLCIFYYCTFLDWSLFYFLRCSFICIILICVLVWSHLRMLSWITFIETFLFNESDHNPNVFCCIVIQKACTYCKCMCEFCACVAQECTYLRVWVRMSLLSDVREHHECNFCFFFLPKNWFVDIFFLSAVMFIFIYILLWQDIFQFDA